MLNATYAEPHRYLANGGDLYYSKNSLFILHDSAGTRYNVSAATPNLQILNQTYDPGTSPPTRGAWAPSGTQYLTMTEYIKSPAASSYAFLHLYNLQYRQTEIGGHVILREHAKIH